MQMELMMWVRNSLLMLFVYSPCDSTQLFQELIELQELLPVLSVLRFPFTLLQTEARSFFPAVEQP